MNIEATLENGRVVLIYGESMPIEQIENYPDLDIKNYCTKGPKMISIPKDDATLIGRAILKLLEHARENWR